MAISLRSALATTSLLFLSGCVIVRFWKTDPRPYQDPNSSFPVTVVRTPVKAHLKDGSTIIFPNGATVDGATLSGTNGRQYLLLQANYTPRTSVRLDSIVGLETFDKKLLVAPTIAVSAAASAVTGTVAAFGTALLLVAIFGSCPTVYADTAVGTAPVLQAEGFSYAIAPLFEHRDVDALKVHRDSDGLIRLELRNEALETHFINHVELLAVRHAAGSRALPDQSGRPIIVGGFAPLRSAVDRGGRDVRANLIAADGRLYASAPSVVAGARVGDLDDWIDLSATDLPPGDSVAVVLRLRNSLLNTVLLYDGLLGGRDAPDYLASATQRIASAIDLSRWYVATMGLRASVQDDRPSTGAATRMGDVGPIAFRDVAMILPRPDRDARSIRVRLRFVADNWRIDRAEIAGQVARPEMVGIPVARIVVPNPAVGTGPVDDTAAVNAVAQPDERYLETSPGQRMTLVFDPRSAAGGNATDSTTYFIAWQGYYNEWIRGSWLAHPRRTEPFVIGDAAVLTALRSWTSRRTELEGQFYTTKIPVR